MPHLHALTPVSLSSMSALFLVCFVAGLVLAVYVMLHGVERPAPPAAGAPHEATGGYDPSVEPSPVVNAQNVAAFAAAFGLAGYVLLRATALPTWGVVALAAVAGALGAAASGALLAAWVIPGARSEAVDERYLLQGHPAQVTRAITPDGDGEITYEADGRRWSVPARAWDGSAIAVGAEVAIERVEGGVAFVEQWAQVEARL